MLIQLSTPADFSFLECVNAHGWKSLAPFDWDAETEVLSRAEYFDGLGAVLLRISEDNGAVRIEAVDAAPADEIIRRVKLMLQLDLDISGFHNYCSASANLAHIPALRQGRLLRSPTVFEDIVKVIATTNTTWAQTKAMVGRIVESFGTALSSDPGRHAFPTPQQICTVPLQEFADRAKMGYRNASVYRIATEITQGRLDLEAWKDPSLSSDALNKRLLSLPGIGPYAAACLMIYLGHYGRVNVDSWARTLMSKEIGTPARDNDVQAFFEPYGEWKALVYHFYQWKEST